MKERKREVRNAKSKTATFEKTDQHQKGTRSPDRPGAGEVPELSRDETASSGLSALRLLQGSPRTRHEVASGVEGAGRWEACLW
jgi:hypothetical protein